MPWPTCDVCGEPACAVAYSAVGPISFAYCTACLRAGAEVPGVLASMIACCGGAQNTAPDILDLIAPSLARARMTREDFEALVEAMIANLAAYDGRVENAEGSSEDRLEDLLEE